MEAFNVGFPREGSTIGQGPTELMIRDGRGTLFFSTHAKHWNTGWRSWFLTSDDSFKTWSQPREVPGRLKERTFIRNHIITRDGRIILPFQHYIGPEAEHAMVPNMVLQPLVENSIRYAIGPWTIEGLASGSLREDSAGVRML